jgi:hypothetical protein
MGDHGSKTFLFIRSSLRRFTMSKRWREIDQEQRSALDVSAEVIKPANNDLCYCDCESCLEKGVSELRRDSCA